MSLFDKRVLIVTGKGGTGKTTATAAIGIRSAQAGKKTLMVECNGANHIAPLFGAVESRYTPTELLPNLSVMTITSEEAIEDYIVQQIKVRALYNLVFRNRIMGPFMDAVPGLHDAVHLGKVFDLTEATNSNGEQAWDLIIVDAPATGHGLSLLASPKSMMDLTRKGPIFEGVRSVQEIIEDPKQTGIILTCLPEHMPVNETVELFGALNKNQVQACILNQMDTTDLPDLSDWSEAKALLLSQNEPALGEAAMWADHWIERRTRQQRSKQALVQELGVPVLSMPMVFEPTIGMPQLSRLAKSLSTTGATE